MSNGFSSNAQPLSACKMENNTSPCHDDYACMVLLVLATTMLQWFRYILQVFNSDLTSSKTTLPWMAQYMEWKIYCAGCCALIEVNQPRQMHPQQTKPTTHPIHGKHMSFIELDLKGSALGTDVRYTQCYPALPANYSLSKQI